MSIKKLILVALIIFAAVVTGILLIRVQDPGTDVTEKLTRVGLILNGSAEDKSFCQTHYDALNSLKDELNLEILVREYVPEDESCFDVIKELVDREKCSVIVTASSGYGEEAVKAATKYPDVCFLNFMGNVKLNNLSSFAGRMYQVRYLSGIVAGMRTVTGEVGYVAAFPYSEVIRGLNAFTQGVRRVRPDAVVHVKYCDSWIDDEAAGAAAKALMDKYPVDVMAMHTNSLEPCREADGNGVWPVGYNMDNSELFPDTYLTSCVWKWESYYREQILDFLKGKFFGTLDWIGMEEGIVELSELTDNVTTGTSGVVDDAKEYLKSRTFDVFYGPIYDNSGNLRVPVRESMSDDEMFNSFDWYVEGVVVEE
ncbi:MAG: BMP family ABC transporter substrate-binding protein [Lachnospiraceae bacterium]|nr:BMP family ABC transporter substrate-binding protein [Lachnospiraceae bacterium]